MIFKRQVQEDSHEEIRTTVSDDAGCIRKTAESILKEIALSYRDTTLSFREHIKDMHAGFEVQTSRNWYSNIIEMHYHTNFTPNNVVYKGKKGWKKFNTQEIYSGARDEIRRTENVSHWSYKYADRLGKFIGCLLVLLFYSMSFQFT